MQASEKGKKKRHQVEEVKGTLEYEGGYSESEGRSRLERDQVDRENVHRDEDSESG